MSGPDGIRLAVMPGPLARAAVSRLVSIAAARADLPLDRVEDARLLGAAIAARAPEHAAGGDGRLELELHTRPGALLVDVAALRPGAVRSLLGDTGAPGAGANVFRRVATRVDGGRGTDACERLRVEITR